MGPSPGVNWRAFSGWRFWSPRLISRFLGVSPQTPLGPARHAAFLTRSRATFPLEDFRPAPEVPRIAPLPARRSPRSEEHTSELQSLRHLVCRLLLEKKKKKKNT